MSGPVALPKTQLSQFLPSITADKKMGLGLEGLGFGYGVGLGIRASMPKLPSFRVIIIFYFYIGFIVIVFL